jgi:phosphopantetheinyl transferase (holo-ACP synthase)
MKKLNISQSNSIQPSSPAEDKIRIPLSIPIHPYLRDHTSHGNIIFPAVEILQWLAASLQKHDPDAPVHCMQSASFDRFLRIDENSPALEACHELEKDDNGCFSSRLITTGLTPEKTIRRTKVHAVVNFAAPVMNDPLPMDIAACLDGVAFEVPAADLYRELVPFGPSYHNVIGNLILTEDGALGQVRAAEYPALSVPLGSPFPFDGALHAACVWGQRYYGMVGFPVGFRQRTILRPTIPGENYLLRVLPFSSPDHQPNQTLQYDIRIYSLKGELYEEINGVLMKDVSGGRTQPPDWILAESPRSANPPLYNIRSHCRGLVLIESRAVSDFADTALTPFEHKRFDKMGSKRKRDFLTGHLALKHLARIVNNDRITPASQINTVAHDGIKPEIAFTGSTIFCSLSHDVRFAVAVADDMPVGIDVERVSARVMKSMHLFASDRESTLIEESELGLIEACLRVWSIKECVSKAIDHPFAECWKIVNVHRIGKCESLLTVSGDDYLAFHDAIDEHLFTLVKKGVYALRRGTQQS